MPGRLPLFALLLSLAVGGCACASEDRIALLESAVLDLQTRDIRLATLEETVSDLVARQESPGKNPEQQPRPGPRRVSPDPSLAASPPARTTPGAAPEPASEAALKAAPPPVQTPAPVPPAPAKKNK